MSFSNFIVVKTAINLAAPVRSRRNRGFAMNVMIEVIARSLVDEPELVFVSAVGEMCTSIRGITVAKTDIGKIIGKHGRRVAGFKEKKQALFEIVV